MADRTQINRDVNNVDNATVLNREVEISQREPMPNATVLNPCVSAEGGIEAGTVLCEKFSVVEKLPVATGEADLYICKYQDQQYVGKVYRRSVAIKPEIVDQLKQIDSPYVAKLYESDLYQGMPVEILPYYRRGSLQGRTFSFEQLKSRLIPSLIEGLNALHSANIIHKDLKPSNIMVADEQGNVAIIDFGISSMTEEGNTVLVTQTGMTPDYSAPETFKGLYLRESDYYSLGITLYELFCGRTPYGKMSAEEIEKYVSIQRIPFPKEMPSELRDLIRALTYYDISNRRDTNNPNRRWGYQEVRKWLSGVRQTIPGEGVDRRAVKPYLFAGKSYTEKSDLLRALIENWNEGKKQLFRGSLSGYYKVSDPAAYEICKAAESEAARTNGKDDLIFWKTMYALEPETNRFFWKGKLYAGLPALGRDLLECLRKQDREMAAFMDSVFKNGIMSQYVAMKESGNTKMLEAVKSLEASHRAYGDNPHSKYVNLYLTAYMLSGQKVLYTAGQEFHTIDELTTYMKGLLGENNEGVEAFKSFCHRLMSQYNRLIPALESWLLALGKQEELNNWKEMMKNV